MCHEAINPMLHNCRTHVLQCALEPVLCNIRSQPRWEAHTPQLESSLRSLQLEKSLQEAPKGPPQPINK